jgi:phosphatidylglycerol:prolipoprotein diacylglycerol transferase
MIVYNNKNGYLNIKGSFLLMLPRILLPIYGPICIQSYGLMIALALIISTYFLMRDKRRGQIISQEQLIHLLTIGIIVGVVGGRVLHVLSCYEEYTHIASIFALYEGGFSILGTTIALLIIIPWYLKRMQVAILPLLDLLCTYAPLAQAIARLGCLFAGCCYGLPTSSCLAITYTDIYSLAPVGIALHPTQLYSSISFVLMFGIMLLCKARPGWAGRDTLIFLTLFSAQRFVVDFWRGDRIFSSFGLSYTISFHQWVALLLGIVSLCMLIVGTYRNNRKVQR